MIELDKLLKQNRSFSYKLFFSYLLFTGLILSAITVIHIYFSDEQKLHKFEREASLQASEKEHQFNEYFKKRGDTLRALANNEYFIKYVKTNQYRYYVDLLFLTMMESNKEFMQMRFIDKSGVEKIRFDRNKLSQEPYKSNILQDKSNRYYFKASSHLSKNDVWFSEIDLNIEHKEIERPFKPVVRVATPIYINKVFQGILVINLFMENLLNNITKSSIYDIYLVDEGGYYMKHKYQKYDWSLYSSKHTIDLDFSDNIVYNIQSSYKNQAVFSNNIYVQSLFLSNQKINMILVEKRTSIEEMNANNNKMIIVILIFAMIFSIIFSFILSRPLKQMYEALVLQSDKLRELAQNLDRKVMIETLKNAKKDRLLQHQSKQAELGEMIGNIAHQWRHPLTRLSLILQNLKAFKKKNKMSDKVFDEALENSLYQISFMSKTIDDFKNFYKKDTEQSNFKIIDSLTDVMKIIGSILEHSNIEININNKCEKEFFGNKNEFSQVLMNIIINAKDALEENNIKQPKISINIFCVKNNIKIEIIDNAKGIPSHIIEDIFDPYFTTKKDKGTGIGLYLCKAIIEEKLKGKLDVINTNDGAKFIILI